MMLISLFGPFALLLPALQAAGSETSGGAGNAGGDRAGTPIGNVREVEIPWNRLYDYPEIYAHFDRLVERWPGLFSMEVIGLSIESRELRVYKLNNPATGADTDKPAMWIDGNVHGNEVQGAEVVLYMAAYLLENYGHNERVTKLVDGSAFYLLPMVNPDGRANWFQSAHNAHSSRTGYRPIDNDLDGQADEDGPDDLDGDGHIVQMRKHVPGEGTHRLDRDDPRLLERVPVDDRGLRGDWILLGSEGIDNDGDGEINEDGPGGYDMNRAWPASWQPDHVQHGAGPYPLYWPETRHIARFLYDHPNIAAVQSFHNAGGMILRGPGAEVFGDYPAADVRVFDELGKDGERMLPFYRYMIIWKDLYTVFGGFATWTYEGLGIISFTNELWTDDRIHPDGEPEGSFFQRRMTFNDELLMGGGYIDWHPYEHPLYGPVEIGGFKKDVGRVPPTFLIEEMLHRNALFCVKHAEAMPSVEVEKLELSDLGDGVHAVDVQFRNTRLIPTRTARAAEVHIDRPDVFEIAGPGIKVLAGGFRTDRFRPARLELAEHQPERLVREEGISGRSTVHVRWFVRGSGKVEVRWRGQKGKDVSRTFTLP